MSRVATAGALWGAAMFITLAGLLLLFATLGADLPAAWGFRGFTSLFAISFATVGALITARRNNLGGWLLLAAGLCGSVQFFGEEYAIYGHLTGAAPTSYVLGAWIAAWIWVAAFTLVIYVLLVFPTGRLPSRRWSLLAIYQVIPAAVLTSGLMFAPGPLENATYLDNPFARPDLATAVQLVPFLFMLMSLGGVATAGSLAFRFRRASGIERQQIKWLAYASALLGLALVTNALDTIAQGARATKAAQYFLITAMLLLPIAMGIAILRHRLYDIDVLINRTLVYGALTAVVGLTYVASIVLAQAVLRPLTSGSELAVAVSTLATLAVVQPLRRRIQRFVDRRFYRSRYDASRTLDRLAQRLRDEVEIERLRSDVLDAVRETMQPAHASLWLRERAN